MNFKDLDLNILTYVLKQKATITISSVKEEKVVISIQRAFKNLNDSAMRIHITGSGKVYIGIGLNLWLESIDKVDINWEEVENYINNLEN